MDITFTVGSRRLLAVSRQLNTVRYSLEQLLAGEALVFDDPADGGDGYRVLSAPVAALETMDRRPTRLIGGLRPYRRHYIDMTGDFTGYLARFSGKTRSTFNRKRRKLAELAGGALTVEAFSAPTEIERFFAEAIPLSRRTYQARLLDAGLPESDADRAAAQALAAADQLRAFLLRIDGRALAYLYLPLEGDTVVYAFLGYDPDYAQYSPGTVLQLDALERLFAERRYRYFDFTEGEGAHKAMFGTDMVEACSFFLLNPGIRNRLLLRSLDGFDRCIAAARHLASKSGLLTAARRMLRS